jgi:hypothetical protein
MQKGESSRRREKQREEAGVEPGYNGPRPVAPGRPAQPIQGPFGAPSNLANPRVIYSAHVKSHASIHSSSTAEEQRS